MASKPAAMWSPIPGVQEPQICRALIRGALHATQRSPSNTHRLDFKPHPHRQKQLTDTAKSGGVCKCRFYGRTVACNCESRKRNTQAYYLIVARVNESVSPQRQITQSYQSTWPNGPCSAERWIASEYK
jgi:hypothetical protein